MTDDAQSLPAESVGDPPPLAPAEATGDPPPLAGAAGNPPAAPAAPAASANQPQPTALAGAGGNQPPQPPLPLKASVATPPKPMPPWVFAVALTWLIALLTIFVIYQTSSGFRGSLPHSLGNQIPVGVPWFGALGGCLISLGGIFGYNANWNGSFNYWHALRPLLGAITGGIGCLLLLVTNQVSTTGTIHTDAAFYYAVAFVFGYAEAAFRTLVTNVTNIILKPGG